ncbi:MAG: transporter permease [Chloroflexi bacterium]|nr:transporter permease [Chloroflexota bacterium]
MIRAVWSLARHRLAGRAGATLLLVAAVAAATGLTGTIRALGLAATDTAIASALHRLDPAERTIRISGYAPSAADAVGLDGAARAAAGAVTSFAGDAAAGAIFRRVRDPGTVYDLQLVAVDGAAAWTTLSEGRPPNPCDGRACEAILLAVGPAPLDLPSVVHVGGLEIRIVGRATMSSPIPIGHVDQRGPQPPPEDPTAQVVDPPPTLLLVDGVQAAAAADGASAIGRTYLWTAALRGETLHPWTVPPFEDALASARRGIAEERPALSLASPSEVLRVELARGATNNGRLLLVGSLGVAILAVFAGYAALLTRRDLRAELDRLAASGAGRWAAGWLVAFEVIVPTAAGTIAGWIIAAGAAGLLFTGAGTDPGGVAAHALGDPDSLVVAGIVIGVAMIAILAGLLGAANRGTLAGLLPGGLALAGLVAWRVVGGGGLDAAAVGGIVDAPILAAIPALVGLAVAAVALAIVPVVLRRLARASRQWAMPIRLAVLSLARDPVRPAATITLLAFGIGGLVFGIADAATLRRGLADQAAFEVGLDFRVSEAASGLTHSGTVVPIERYETLGPDVDAYPVVHVLAGAGPAGEVTLLGLPPAALSAMRGWRDDLGTDPATLQRAIEVDGTFVVPGVQLPAEATTIEVTVTHAGDPVHLTAVVVTSGGDAARIFLGTLRPGSETLGAPLPTEARGGRVIAVILSEARLIAGADHGAGLARATLTFEGLDAITGAAPVEVQVSGVRSAILRAPLPTDDLVLPAIAGPAIADAARAAPGGMLTVMLGDRALARIRVVGVLPRFPGLPEAGSAYLVVSLDPLLMAMDGAAPGAGRPDEAWLRVDDPTRHETVEEALTAPPFRSAAVRSRTALEFAAASDPFAGSILAAFAAASIAGLLLAALGLVLGTMADLRDETGELRDMEAQGVGPRALRRQVGARTAVLAVAGTVAGTVMGVGLTLVVTAAVGVAADGRRPIPALVPELPLAQLAAAVVVPTLAAAALGALAAWRSFRTSTRSRDRA